MRNLFHVTAAVGALLLSACDSSNIDELDDRLLVATNNITGIEISTVSPVVSIDGTRALTMAGTVANGEVIVTSSANWSSSDPTLVTVNSEGVVTGVADGTAIITGTLGPFEDTLEVRASSAALEVINISVEESVTDATINVCTSAAFSATGDFDDGETGRPLIDEVAWTVVAGSVGVFDPEVDGLLRSNTAGTGTVQAALDGITATFDLTVQDNLSTITITSDGTTLSASNTVQYTATATYDNDAVADITDNAAWTLDATFASVDNILPDKGLVTATSTGTETLQVDCGGVNGTLPINSGSATAVTGLEFEPDSVARTIFTGIEEIEMRIFARFENGTIEDVTEDSEWRLNRNTGAQNTLSNLDDSKGLVTFREPGEMVFDVLYRDFDIEPAQTFFSESFTIIRDAP